MRDLVNKHFPLIIYLLCFSMQSLILYQGLQFGLFPMPHNGMDQLTFLQAAVSLYSGHIPEHLMLSPIYTVFVWILILLSGGNLITMRILQSALCSLIPVIIYKLSSELGLKQIFGQIAALLHCFYAAAMLISIEFLRSTPLSLCYICTVYLLTKAYFSKKAVMCFFAGIMASFCILGRENFIPIAVAPLLVICFHSVRKNISYKQILAYITGIFILLTPIIIYNYFHHGTLEIIPGNVGNISRFYLGTDIYTNPFQSIGIAIKNIPQQLLNLISSYEKADTLSLYAHKDIIDMLKIASVPFNLLIILSLFGIFLNYKNMRLIIVFLAVTAYSSTMMFFEMFYRFRIPIEPLLCVLSGAGISGLYYQSPIKKLLWLIILISLFFLTWQSPDKIRSESEKIIVADIFLSNGYVFKAKDIAKSLNPDSHYVKALNERISKKLQN